MVSTVCDSELAARTPRRVLVVDDEQRMAISINLLLEAVGYEVDTAFSGAEALKCIEKRDYPIVITDLRMPDVDGLDLIRTAAAKSGVAFIVITGHSSAENAIEALRLHAVDFISKPFEFDVLKASVEKAFVKVEAERFRHDTLSMITHDIKMPLSSILGYSSLVFNKEGELNPRAHEFVQTISSNGLRMLSLIDNFLTSCKIDAGRLSIYFRDVNLQYILEDLTTMLQVDLNRNHLTLDCNLAVALPVVQGDENLLFRALGNVLSNACKYTPDHGFIRLKSRTLTADQSPLKIASVLLEVSNSGPGIAAEDLDSIFDRYQRTRTTAGTEGSGLGSYVTQRIVQAHGGCVTVQSEPNQLTTFSVHLPVERPLSW